MYQQKESMYALLRSWYRGRKLGWATSWPFCRHFGWCTGCKFLVKAKEGGGLCGDVEGLVVEREIDLGHRASKSEGKSE